MAERAVQEAKRILKKTQFATPDFYNALLEIRATPRNETLGSPMERLMSRQPRTKIPCLPETLRPKLKQPEAIVSGFRKLKNSSKHQFDKNARVRKEFELNEGVRILDPHTRTWNKGIIVEICNRPRSYIAREAATGRQLERNKSHLRHTVEPISLAQTSTSESPPALLTSLTSLPSTETPSTSNTSLSTPELPNRPQVKSRKRKVVDTPLRFSERLAAKAKCSISNARAKRKKADHSVNNLPPYNAPRNCKK